MKTRALLSLLLCRAVSAVAAPPEEDTAALEALLATEVVTGASRAQERSDDAPAPVTVVTSDDFKRYGLRTLGDAINFFSVGLVTQDPLHAIEIGSRGVLLNADYGNHVLVVIDGHVMNEQWNGTAYFEHGLGLPLEFIDRVELIVGPGSVLYGSSAMLGVINVITKHPRDLGVVSVAAEGSLAPPQDVNGAPRLPDASNFMGGSGRVSLMAGHETTLAGAPLEVSFAAEYFAHRGQSLTFPVQTGLPERWGARSPGPGTWGGTTTDAWWTQAPSALLKVRWGDFRLWARGAMYSRGSPAYDTLGAAADFDAPNLERDRALNVELGWARQLSSRVRLMARAYVDFYDYLASSQASSWSTYGSGELPERFDPLDFTFRHEMKGAARWGGLEAQGVVDWLGDGRFPFMLGVDGRLRRFSDATQSSTLDDELISTGNSYAVDEWQVGVYAQQRARPVKQLQLIAGARVDMQAAFPARISPRLAVVWTLPWQGRLKAVLDSAYRTPSGYERYADYGAYQLQNPNLGPEHVTTGELGYEQRLGPHRLFATAFVSDYQRLIGYVPVEGQADTYQYANYGSILNVGGQGGVEGAAGNFRYAANFTGAVNLTQTPLVASPGWFGNVRVSYAFGDGRPRVSLAGAFSGERLITAAMAEGPNGETWEPGKQRVPPQLELRAAVDAPLPFAKGLWVRGVVGGQVMPFSAYTVGPRQAPEEGFLVPAQAPNSRLFVMLTLGWSLEPAR